MRQMSSQNLSEVEGMEVRRDKSKDRKDRAWGKARRRTETKQHGGARNWRGRRRKE